MSDPAEDETRPEPGHPSRPPVGGRVPQPGAGARSQGDHKGSLADFDLSLKLDPDQAKVYEHRGATKYSKGNTDAAIADYDEAIRRAPRLVTYLRLVPNARQRKAIEACIRKHEKD